MAVLLIWTRDVQGEDSIGSQGELPSTAALGTLPCVAVPGATACFPRNRRRSVATRVVPVASGGPLLSSFGELIDARINE